MEQQFEHDQTVRLKQGGGIMRVGSICTTYNCSKNTFEPNGYYRCFWVDWVTGEGGDEIYHQSQLVCL